MLCPKCGSRTEVRDSRMGALPTHMKAMRNHSAIRRRRKCPNEHCCYIFTTMEIGVDLIHEATKEVAFDIILKNKIHELYQFIKEKEDDVQAQGTGVR